MNFISNILVKIERGIFNNPRVSLGAILLLTAYFALQIRTQRARKLSTSRQGKTEFV